MKKIFLTGLLGNGKFAVVDNADFEFLNLFKWHLYNGMYARRRAARDGGTRKFIYMHREILHVSNKTLVDHKNRNGLDNRRKNLRKCNFSQNSYNSKKRVDNTSGCKGVSLSISNKWYVRINVNKKCRYIGIFNTKKEAIIARRNAEFVYHKDFLRV